MLRQHSLYAVLFVSVFNGGALDAGAAEKPLTEQQKINALIAHIEGLEGATFIRNGREYDAETAAQFLRGKWQARGSEIRTARDFVEDDATASSTTGRPYLIRLRDGTETRSGEYLLSHLKVLEKAGGAEARPEKQREAKQTEPAGSEKPPQDGGDSASEPVEVILRQRDTRGVPGLKDVQISIGDITEGRVAISITGAEKKVLLEPVLVLEGDVVDVAIGGKLYVVRVVDLANALIGQDFATLSIAPAEAAPKDAARAGIRVILRAAPETESRTVQQAIESLNALRIGNLKQSAGKEGSGISAEIRAGEATPSGRIARTVEALLDAGVDRISVELQKPTAVAPRPGKQDRAPTP